MTWALRRLWRAAVAFFWAWAAYHAQSLWLWAEDHANEAEQRLNSL